MPDYRLIFTAEPKDSIRRAVSFTASDAAEALFLAQRHASPAQLWIGEKQLCTISRSGSNGEFWIIS
ncbi:MAG: hypothetical protein WCY29_09315 [Novosphingobium sp.]